MLPGNRTALTIAGFDPSSGAGITADLQVFAAHGIFGTSAITALTVQNTMGVRAVSVVDAPVLHHTLATLEEDLPPQGIKLGMLGGAAQVEAVIAYLCSIRERKPWVVLDPVLRSSSGAELLEEHAVELLREHLLPMVDAVTPNVQELAVLTGDACSTEEEIAAAARKLSAVARCVVVTGGDRTVPNDHVFIGDSTNVLEGEHITTQATHGTGCAFSSAMLCGLMQGKTAVEAAHSAKQYVAQAMRLAIPRGRGRGPMHLLWPVSGQ